MAYFGAAGTLGRLRMHAWVSASTHGLRERLRGEPHGLVFATPLTAGTDAAPRDERMQAELREASQVRPTACNNLYREGSRLSDISPAVIRHHAARSQEALQIRLIEQRLPCCHHAQCS